MEGLEGGTALCRGAPTTRGAGADCTPPARRRLGRLPPSSVPPAGRGGPGPGPGPGPASAERRGAARGAERRGARRSRGDAELALGALLLQQLLPLLPCPHRHHHPGHLVPGFLCPLNEQVFLLLLIPFTLKEKSKKNAKNMPSGKAKIINSVVLLILLSALTDPDQYHLTSAELGGEFEFMDDANMCIATAISLLMILICAMATYGAYKQHAAWIIPFFCYQIFDFALNTLVAISVLVYPSTIQDYLRQLPNNFPYKEEIMSVNPTCLVVIILLFISIILAFKGYLISCVWNCYRYINSRNNSDVLVYITTNDTAVLLPPYDDPVNGAAKDPPPPYVSA
uniref:Lysosomal-associated transmembrane protein 4B n=2 Tax=Telluraves TaxID=3073808 RepID=A0A8B9M184_9AVES